MHVYIGADHGGFELKEKVKTWLKEWGYTVDDVGATTLDPQDDYPDFAFSLARQVSAQDDRSLPWSKRVKGILACRSAAGAVIAANKIKGIRAVAVFNEQSAKHSREHNDANVLGLSGDWLTDEQAKAIVKTWLTTEYSHEARHERRIQKIISEEST